MASQEGEATLRIASSDASDRLRFLSQWASAFRNDSMVEFSHAGPGSLNDFTSNSTNRTKSSRVCSEWWHKVLLGR